MKHRVHLIFLIFSATSLRCYSLPAANKTLTDQNEMNELAPIATQGRQDAIGAPLAASLAFVGMNLAFISLLVPFVITSLVFERRGRRNDKDWINSIFEKTLADKEYFKNY